MNKNQATSYEPSTRAQAEGLPATNTRGFTLIEILVASAILVILAVGFVGLQYILSQNQVSAWRNYLSIENANVAVSTLTRELRNARPSETGTYPLEVTSDQEIIFYTDFDYDGKVERVRYTLTGSNLLKAVVEPVGEPATYPISSEKVKTVSEIIRNGANPLFYYYNSDWPTDTVNNPLPTANRISETRQIKIILRTNTDANNADRDYILESDARLRMIN